MKDSTKLTSLLTTSLTFELTTKELNLVVDTPIIFVVTPEDAN